jgi:site-specific DNA-methyltransferase (adenine-specific)
MAWLCRLVTPPGGLVIDPFLGSGTTLLAAQEEGLRGIGIELAPEYVKIATARLQDATRQGRLF